jgi:purine nucleosidase
LVALANELKYHKEKMTLLALGPATLFASLIRHRPDLKHRIDKIIWVAGRQPGERLFIGQRCAYEFHDANFEKDPAAAQILLDSEIPMILIPVGLGTELMLTADDFSILKRQGGSAGSWLTRRSRLWLFLWKIVFGLKGAPVFDCLAVLAASAPDLLDFSTCRIEVLEGKRVELHYQLNDTGPHQVCTSISEGARKALF